MLAWALVGCLDWSRFADPTGDPAATADDPVDPVVADGSGNGGATTTPSDDACTVGVAAFCSCSKAYDAPCTHDDQQTLYAECLDGSDGGLVECLAGYVDPHGSIDCYASITRCLGATP